MKKAIYARLAAVPAVVLATVGSAYAALPTELTTEMSTMKENGVALATGFLVAIVAVGAFKLMRRGI